MRTLRTFLGGCAMLLSAAAAAQTAVETTKPDAIQTLEGSAPTMSAMPLLQMLLAVGIVLALVKFLLPKIATRMSKRLSSSLGGAIRIEEGASFAGGNLYLVSVRDRELLLGVSASGVSCLADLTASKPVAPPSFLEVLEEAEAAPTSAVAAVHPAEIEEALRRLDSLSG